MPVSKRFQVEKGGHTRLAGGPDPQARARANAAYREVVVVDGELSKLDRRIDDMVIRSEPPI
jgi:hypothetical protein